MPHRLIAKKIDQVSISPQQFESELQNFIADFQPEGERAVPLVAEVSLPQYWLPESPAVNFTLTVKVEEHEGSLQPVQATWASSPDGLGPVTIDLTRGIPLEAVHIPKPWGQEIWYTGVEERGVCSVAGEGGNVPLPWLIETLGKWLGMPERQLVLLKILDPLSQEVWGDLYFELHEEKQEVYVVTHVDETAWPGGEGAIRFGFDPGKVAAFDSEADFKAAYSRAVAEYETVRREVDSLLDEQRTAAGFGLNEALGPAELEPMLAKLPAALLDQERTLRAAMDDFTRLRPLKLGDVVKVPLRTPHSLQHGVRTVEFQTPVYERRILSFAQKVLTQGHWDTSEGVALMELTAPPEPPHKVLQDEAGLRAERIVDFDNFQVDRLNLEAGATYSLSLPSYCIAMGVSGTVSADGLPVTAEQACVIPRRNGALRIENSGKNNACLLLAYPPA